MLNVSTFKSYTLNPRLYKGDVLCVMWCDVIICLWSIICEWRSAKCPSTINSGLYFTFVLICRCLFIFLGTAGDSFSFHNGLAFSTKDQDNDLSTGNCARFWKGGWWFKHCHRAFLNGFYYKGSHSNSWGGVMWDRWKGASYSAKRAEMKIKPVNV